MDWSIIATIVGTLFSTETIRILLHRKTSKRVAEADADASEFNVLKETMTFLQEQLNEKEKRFAEQTALVRKLNAENLALTRKVGELETELALKRCNKLACIDREPPNIYTPIRAERPGGDNNEQKQEQ